MALTELSYVGTRPYIRGADLYTWFERQIVGGLSAGQKPVECRQFRLVSEVRCDGSWREGVSAGASATLDVVDDGGRSQRYSFLETGDIIRRHVPDIPSNLRSCLRSGAFSGTAFLTAPRVTTDLLNGLIEANKRLHAETLAERGSPADHIRLIFVENFPIDMTWATDCHIEFRHLGERKAADRTYTLNAVQLGDRRNTLRICYSY